MILYIIKSILCSGILISVYFIFLQKEKMHQFNRFYLLIALPLFLIIPLLTIELSEETPIVQNIPSLEEFVAIPLTAIVSLNEPQPIETEHSYLPIFLLYGYLLISLSLLLRSSNNLFKILKTIRFHLSKRIDNASLIVVDEPIIPHTFLHYIFISKADVENDQIITHELTHARQKHSLDILFIELVQCLLWINPFIFLYKRAIKLNHEFIADDAVVHDCSETSQYQKLLLIKSTNQNSYPLASSFSYSLTKKRFIMMATSKNQTRSVIKIVMTSILLLGTVLIFSEKVYAQTSDNTGISVIKQDTLVSRYDTLEFDIIVSGLRKVVKKKDGKIETYYNFTGFTDEKKNRIIFLYEHMSEKQKSDPVRTAVVKFCYPIPAPTKASPTAQQMNDWSDPTIYGVWLDGKRIQNAELTKYKSTDIAHVFMSRLMKNAAHYGQYKFHIDLMTHAYFDKSYPTKSE